MKKIALFIFSAALLAAQSVNVQKTSGTNEVTGSLVIGSGKTLTATGNGTIVATSAASVSGNVTITSADTLTVNGIMTGTPTSGTLSLANLTLTLPTSPTFGGTWTGAQGGTGVANTGKTITLGGNLTTVGAYNLGVSLAGNTAITLPTSGTLVGSADTGTVTNTMLAGSIANSKLGNASLTLGSTSLALGSTTTTVAGLTLTTPILGTATATSITAPAATDLTLAGGSSGASLVLGQGTIGSATITTNGTAGKLSVATAAQQIAQFSSTYPTTGSYVSFYDGVNLATRGYVGWGTSLGMGAIGNFGIAAASNLYLGSSSGASNAVFTSTGNLLIGTTTDMSGSGGVKIAGTTAATNTTSGALQVAGGVGVSGAGYFGGNLIVSGTTDATAGTLGTGALQVAGGASFTKKVNVGDTLTVANPVIDARLFNLSSNYTGAGVSAPYAVLFSSADPAITGARIVGDTYYVGDSGVGLKIQTRTNAGVLQDVISWPKNTNGTIVGGNLTVSGTTEATTGGAGSLTTQGGIYAAKAIVANGNLITSTQTPASASATGIAGTITWDANYIYICTATNTWKRVAIATW